MMITINMANLLPVLEQQAGDPGSFIISVKALTGFQVSSPGADKDFCPVLLRKGHFASERASQLKISTTTLATGGQSSNLTNQICSFSPEYRLARLCSAILFIYLGDVTVPRKQELL